MNVKHKLDALTSLRFFAAAMIVLTHAHPIFGSFGIAEAAPLGQGVSFFFVLSGFILAYNYKDFSKDGSIKRFLVARFARVWPLHLVTCIIWIGLIFHFDRYTYFGGETGMLRLISNLTLVQSWIPLKLWALSFNGVAWSISNEMFFYLLFPLLIGLWSKHWAKLFFAATLVVVAFIWAGNALELKSTDNYNGVSLLGTLYFNPLVRVFEFMFGIFLAKVFMTPAIHEFKASQLGWLYLELMALGLVVAGMLLAGNPTRIADTFGTAAGYYFQREGIWLIWGTLILVFALSKGPIGALLSTRPLVFLGEISFSLYLVHAILITFIEPYTAAIKPYGLTGYAIFWIVALTSSALLYKGIEDPCRHLIMNAWDRRHASVKDNLRSSYGPVAISCVLVLIATVAAFHLNRF
ncbi:acyltransferase [Pseudomonas tensinigenes]|uniref:Acyltransferase n=1 Tax=Pseudomonas tensinigenes TaxID=2745511 RepID=A0ABX8PTW2_9PSED|nr:acyltransferase [Pseudomonas tensinigenes]QXI04665.1 acyltransferase [Pseudomonas tensinigenes]